MEQALRKKFIGISCGVVFVVLATIALVVNVASYLEVVNSANEIIQVLGENDGQFPQVFDRLPGRMNAETPYMTRYFTVRIDANNNLISTDTRSVQMVNTQQAIAHAETVLSDGGSSGFVEHYRYQVVEQDGEKLLIFLDCSQDLAMFYTLLRSTVLVCIIALVCVLILMVLLSKKAVSPIVDSYRKQQEFITNVTHELKTPLAIIKTNTEVMEMEHDTSQWSQSIHNQIARLNELIGNLISLAKMEEGEREMVKVDFSLSEAIAEVADGFDVLAQKSGHTIERHLPANLTYCGEEVSLRLLISTLIDNALKYSCPASVITLSLEEQKERIRFTICNEAEGLHVGKYDMLFERFYRMENSRNSKLGGYGIGLAMAKSIVKSHGGTIRAESKDGRHMRFIIDL